MANIFGRVTQGRWMDLWYHFAIMFEALFILTTLDAGTRVGRYLLQGVFGQFSPALGDTKRIFPNVLASGLVVAGWGYFLIQGVRDPLGGINSLWPLFGIANQLLASIALCLGTTIILKSQLAREGGRKAYAFVTVVPLVWLLTVTMTAGLEKIFHSDPKVGFLAAATALEGQRGKMEGAVEAARREGNPEVLAFAERELKAQPRLVFNNRLNAIVAGTFLSMVALILVSAVREWLLLLAGNKEPRLSETKPVWLTPEALAGERALPVMGMLALGCALAREVSGQGAIEREVAREENAACVCEAGATGEIRASRVRRNVYLSVTERKFRTINRCC
jgi:carbon starvation protein